MKNYTLSNLNTEERERLLRRPFSISQDVMKTATEIVERVARDGDRAVIEFTKRFAGIDLESPAISTGSLVESCNQVSSAVRDAIRFAAGQIARFHRPQIPVALDVRTAAGVNCRRAWFPIETVGLYVPGGTAPLISTVLMLGIPAKLAGCERIVLCTPPAQTGKICPEILCAAAEVGIEEIYSIGGAQAIAAMAVGTTMVPKVDKIFGPGNRYVAAAKSIVAQPPYSVAVDLVAGPSELLVVADDSANPVWVAADLLSQAEHGEGSQVVLVSDSQVLIEQVTAECDRQIKQLPRKELLMKAWGESFSLLVSSVQEGIGFANDYAPEHLQLSFERAEHYVPGIRNAGSVFIGPQSSVVFGDYASGTNHTLPTNLTARATGGITVESFMKSISFQTLTAEGCSLLLPAVETLARAEGLEAHARAARCRGREND